MAVLSWGVIKLKENKSRLSINYHLNSQAGPLRDNSRVDGVDGLTLCLNQKALPYHLR